jgi:membrane protease subunit (stomatin/prohibitin family)
MGLFSRLKRQLPSVIEWLDDSKDIMVYRFPMQGKEIMLGSKLTVRESQVAVFVHKGKIADIFEPGFYRLETSNLPIITKLMSWKTGFETPFKAEVYFVNTRQFTDQKWGTVNPIMMRDPELGVIRIRGYGKYSFRVFDAEKFLNELFGTQMLYTVSDINEYLRSFIISDISDTLAELKISALDVTANIKEISAAVERNLNEDFKRIGLKLVKVVIENLSVPQEVEKAMDTRAKMGIMGDKLGAYMQYQAADAITEAAKNPGGGLASAGVGLGAGVGIGQMFTEALKGAQNQGGTAGSACASCGATIAAGAKFCPKCGKPAAGGIQCPKCKTISKEGSKFCTECGFSLERKCAECGSKLTADAKFCPSCGKKTE